MRFYKIISKNIRNYLKSKQKIKPLRRFNNILQLGGVNQMEKKRLSKLLLVSLIIGVLYLIYSASSWSGAVGSGDTSEQIGSGIAAALVMPHLVMTVLAVIFNALGLFMHKRGFALTGAILYTVALVLFPLYFMFVIVEMILSYVGFAKMKK